MMKKVGIITLNGNYNFGNKLQNYALQTILIKNNLDAETIMYYEEKKDIYDIKNIVKFFIRKRYRNFCKFDKKIKYSKYYFYKDKNINLLKEKFASFFVGSDQVWNPTIGVSLDVYLLSFAHPKQRNSISASFGISELPRKYNQKFRDELKNFNSISVREEEGKKIIEQLEIEKDIKVLIDPTMMLQKEEWDKILNKPKIISERKYILNYFLGELSDERKNEIYRIAEENNCEVINILDKSDPYYQYGPSEFLYLEKNAFLICTDSFHSCVFALLYNTPFIVFDREQSNIVCMNSRINTLLNKFELENRRFDGKILKESLNCDYSNAYRILNIERLKMNEFIKLATKEID